MIARFRKRLCALAAACLLSVAVPVAADAAVSADSASQQISERFGVEVLRVRPGEIDGRAVWMLTVMQPGGDSNSAFQVHTLAVDRESGELVPSFRHHADGVTLPPPAPGAVLP
jgi:hypothetical protein